MKRRCGSEAFPVMRQPSVIEGSGLPATGTQKKQNRNASRQENQCLSFVRSSVRTEGHIIDRKSITHVGECKDGAIEWRITSYTGESPAKGRIGNPGERNATDRCRAREEFDSSGGWNRN